MNISKYIGNCHIKISEEDILSFLKIKKRWPLNYPWGQPSIEIINNYNNTVNNFFFDSDGYLNYDNWYEYYKKGFTTILSDVLDLNNQLRKINMDLKYKIGNEVNANFYFSKSKQLISFKPHTHPYPVIVKQIYGQCDWKIGNEDITLNPQDAIFIPKETVHGVENSRGNRLSLTINLK